MADLDSLPADQRAALQLLLKQGQSYDQLASLLGIGPDAVRDRAHAAVAGLGPATDLSESERAAIADYLLGQQSESEREGTRLVIAGSDSAQAWARGASAGAGAAGRRRAAGHPERRGRAARRARGRA